MNVLIFLLCSTLVSSVTADVHLYDDTICRSGSTSCTNSAEGGCCVSGTPGNSYASAQALITSGGASFDIITTAYSFNGDTSQCGNRAGSNENQCWNAGFNNAIWAASYVADRGLKVRRADGGECRVVDRMHSVVGDVRYTITMANHTEAIGKYRGTDEMKKYIVDNAEFTTDL
ncbi:hypothetical protein N431DRAFT_474102 [Stipitochalara longipes BDJ]|nr:hypothetical protein N431DRAFT_474102 [Stipitochalara longipes BDJ]